MPKLDLCAPVLNLGDRILGKVGKSNFIALLGKRGHNGFMPLKTVCLNLGGFGEEFYSSSSRAGLLIRIRVCQGLHSFNLASDGLLWNELLPSCISWGF